MDLRTWLAGDLRTLRQRLNRSVLSAIPSSRMAEQVDGGGIAPIYVLWHTARHHDLAVNVILRHADEVLDGWTNQVGVTSDTWRGLAEAEDVDLVEQLDPTAVGHYIMAVINGTIDWVSEGDLEVLDRVVDGGMALSRIGTPEDRFDWLYSMWDGKPGYFFLSWEAIGHGVSHLGELTSIRNRMGLSPF